MKTIHGYLLEIDPSVDKGVELSLFETGTYEKGVLEVIRRYFDPKTTFVDVGANIGHISLFVSKNFPSANILAFEPHPETFKILKRNCELNEVDNINYFENGLGAESTEATIYNNWEVNRGGASITVNTDGDKGHSIDIKALDDVVAAERIGIIKIDVEGFEMEVLKGSQEIIKRDKPVLIIEVSDERSAGCTPLEIYQMIVDFGGYEVYKLKGTKERVSKLIKISSIDELPAHDNIICLPKGE